MADYDKVHKLLDQIGEERGKGRMHSRAFTIDIVLMFLIFLGNLYYKVTGFDVDEFMVNLQEHATASVWPVYSAELKTLADDAVPAISAAMADEAAGLLPKVSEKLSGEAIIFQQNMGEHIKTSLDGKFVEAAKAQEGDLKARFPRFSEDPEAYEQLMERMQAASRLWAQGQLDTTFQRHVLLLQSINESVQKLQTQVAADREVSGDRSMEDVLFMMSDIFNTRVGGEG